ncbi:hypothetical protein A0H81_01865 [Grifola frondosa]|uniref:Uncharacterized protein n=1 Tax=Grifola frondosa TaxID=5627 RepID=A0A1C7MMA3_GRIFR|nr:hypothetical protein A0H81_01865 [Grifola frondosa]
MDIGEYPGNAAVLKLVATYAYAADESIAFRGPFLLQFGHRSPSMAVLSDNPPHTAAHGYQKRIGKDPLQDQFSFQAPC